MSKNRKELKQSSYLQNLQRRTNHVAYFRLHNLSEFTISSLEPSANTWHLLQSYNRVVDDLRRSILKDYQDNKKLIDYYRKQAADKE